MSKKVIVMQLFIEVCFFLQWVIGRPEVCLSVCVFLCKTELVIIHS